MVFRWRQLHLEQSLLDSATLLQRENDDHVENGDDNDIEYVAEILKEKMPRSYESKTLTHKTKKEVKAY